MTGAGNWVRTFRCEAAVDGAPGRRCVKVRGHAGEHSLTLPPGVIVSSPDFVLVHKEARR